ncbi:MAG: hypothetical protein IJS07_02835 [Bacteroidales bacterium]|nr:hypothetical protein [Bacteroidales bacterium]
MRKISLFFLSSAIMLAAACNGNDRLSKESTVTACAEQATVVTKVELNADEGLFAWQAGDTLALCSSTRGTGSFVPFAIVGGGRSSEAVFRGALSDSSIKDCAVYPYIKGSEPFFQNKELYVNLPASFQRWEGSAMPPMYSSGISSDGKLHFTHLGGVLHVRLNKIPAGTAMVTVSSGSRLSGPFRVDSSVSLPSIVTEPATGEDCTVTTTMAPLAAAQAWFDFNFPLPVGVYSRLRIQARSANGEVLGSYMSEGAVSISRGAVCMLTPVEDLLPRFGGSPVIKVSPDGVNDAKYNVTIVNNSAYGWTLSLVSFSGCVSAASVEGNVLTYSVPASAAEGAEGQIVLCLSDPTGAEASLTRTYTVLQTAKSDRYFVKVTAEKEDWSGQYLLVYESENEAFVMYTNDEYADGGTGGFVVPLENEGIAYSSETLQGLLDVRKHAPDASGAVHKNPVEGKYTMFIWGSTGLGRYAGEKFGFNNNDSYGRFVETFSYDAAAGCTKISCTTKSSGEAYFKFDSAFMIFGFGLPSEMTEEGRYCDIQLYELK